MVVNLLKSLTYILLAAISFGAHAFEETLSSYHLLYKQRFNDSRVCQHSPYRLCADALRNDGNAPYVLHHERPTKQVVVLFHGLSDSPFYFKGVAEYLHSLGLNVIVPLLPGHGLKDADTIMQDKTLADQWQAHVAEVMAIAPQFGEQVFIGGFSTGGALAVDYTLDNPDSISGLLLFGAALALSDNAESLSRIWGIQWLAGILDGKYQTEGPNPYKYPTVANFAGLELMQLIREIRAKLEEPEMLNLPLFAVHSKADITAPSHGVEQLLDYNRGINTALLIHAKYNVCHSATLLTPLMVAKMNTKAMKVDARDPCAIPKANPFFRKMTQLLKTYFAIAGPSLR